MTFEAPAEAFISSQKFRNGCGVFPCSNSDLYHLLHYEDVKYAQNCIRVVGWLCFWSIILSQTDLDLVSVL